MILCLYEKRKFGQIGMHTGRMSCEHEGRGHGEVSINPGILKSARGKGGG